MEALTQALGHRPKPGETIPAEAVEPYLKALAGDRFDRGADADFFRHVEGVYRAAFPNTYIDASGRMIDTPARAIPFTPFGPAVPRQAQPGVVTASAPAQPEAGSPAPIPTPPKPEESQPERPEPEAETQPPETPEPPKEWETPQEREQRRHECRLRHNDLNFIRDGIQRMKEEKWAAEQKLTELRARKNIGPVERFGIAILELGGTAGKMITEEILENNGKKGRPGGRGPSPAPQPPPRTNADRAKEATGFIGGIESADEARQEALDLDQEIERTAALVEMLGERIPRREEDLERAKEWYEGRGCREFEPFPD